MAEEQPRDAPATPPPVPEHGPAGHHHARPHLPPFKFLEELKRRNVGRVAILYIILGYVVLETFGVFLHLLDLPPWVGRSAVLLVVLGFPVALLIAWIYEITPEGLKPTDEVAPHKSIRHLTGRRLDRAIIAVLAIALSYFVIDKFWLSSHRAVAASTAPASTTAARKTAAAPIKDKSIAVLPFLDMSERHDQGYFADGMAEELIDLLARTSALHVIARTSSFSFRGKPDDIPTIAAKLKVSHILEGSVRKSGNRLRVTTQLVRADNGEHVWSETYDREEKDVFKVQDEIATAVVATLKLKLTTNQQSALQTTSNVDAYNAYLLGRQFLTPGNEEAYRSAAAAFAKAIAIDPHFSDAYAGLSAADFSLGGATGDDVWFQRAGAAADKAIALAPNSSLGYRERAFLRADHLWDWKGAEADFDKAIALNPGDGGTYTRYGMFLISRGRWAEALPAAKKATELDPLSPNAWVALLEAHLAVHNLAASLEAGRRALDIAPMSSWPLWHYGVLKLINGEAAQAVLTFRKIDILPFQLAGVAVAEYTLGHDKDSLQALAELKNKFASDSAYQIAEVHAWRKEKDAAFEWLERAYSQRDGGFDILLFDPLLDPVRNDPRFKIVLRRMELPD